MTAAAQAKHKEFDYCLIVFDGYRRMLVPKEAAMQFFRGILGKDLYYVNDWYDMGNSCEVITPVQPRDMPSLVSYTATQFHLARANAERKEEKEAQSKLP